MRKIMAPFFGFLTAGSGNWSLAWGLVLGMMFGLTPLLGLHNLIILLLVLALRVNVLFFILSAAVFSLLFYLTAPLTGQLGESLLTAEGLEPLWYSLYEVPLARVLQFNNTVMLGSLVASLLFAPVFLFISHHLVRRFRPRVNRLLGTQEAI